MRALNNPSAGNQEGRWARVRYLWDLNEIEQIPDAERELLARFAQKCVVRANYYYLQLINWADQHDPIRAIVIPGGEEFKDSGEVDASHERSYTVAQGGQHKYRDIVLLPCNEVCGACCRYCFLKRLFIDRIPGCPRGGVRRSPPLESADPRSHYGLFGAPFRAGTADGERPGTVSRRTEEPRC